MTGQGGGMSALPTLLTRLAELLPERFTKKHVTWLCQISGEWFVAGVGDDFDAQGKLLIEGACREECAARGWLWRLESSDGGGTPECTACIALPGQSWGRLRFGNTPAEALAGAVLAALRGEG